MKSIYLSLMALCAIAIAGCSTEANSLAEEDLTVDDVEQYEKDLAAVSGGESYDDVAEDDAE